MTVISVIARSARMSGTTPGSAGPAASANRCPTSRPTTVRTASHTATTSQSPSQERTRAVGRGRQGAGAAGDGIPVRLARTPERAESARRLPQDLLLLAEGEAHEGGDRGRVLDEDRHGHTDDPDLLRQAPAEVHRVGHPVRGEIGDDEVGPLAR